MFTVTYFKYIIEGVLVPVVALPGVLANSLAIVVLNHNNVKLKKSLVHQLCSLALFDNLFLLAALFMFSLPVLSKW